MISQKRWCSGRDSNPHAQRALIPETSAYTKFRHRSTGWLPDGIRTRIPQERNHRLPTGAIPVGTVFPRLGVDERLLEPTSECPGFLHHGKARTAVGSLSPPAASVRGATPAG